MALEDRFDTSFVAALANREKQIQQSYRPIIGVHKWFARRPGTLFRSLLLAEFVDAPLQESFFSGHRLDNKVVADPFMGGGTPLIEANRLGLQVIGTDINPMAFWIVRQSLAELDLDLFKHEIERVTSLVHEQLKDLYETECIDCHDTVPVKYFLHVKTSECQSCNERNDLFPGYLIARNVRHTAFVWYCNHCEQIAEVDSAPKEGAPVSCPHCALVLPVGRGAHRGRYTCKVCSNVNEYFNSSKVPEHRLIAIEYHCTNCRKNGRKGRHFKSPDAKDLHRLAEAQRRLSANSPTCIPDEAIPEGDETNRLHRWGYQRYRDLFSERQLLGLTTLMQEIRKVPDREVRQALSTVFSDMLRYQNMLCRYDTMALKCQDIFSVHGFPVGLIQCENNVLGIPKVGSGGFLHFAEKYLRAKEYCTSPFEVSLGQAKKRVVVHGETIRADFVDSPEQLRTSMAYLAAGDAAELELRPKSLDGVFTDPPYFDNVQYAELMDFCFVWLKRLLEDEVPAFRKPSTRDIRELTGNATLNRGIVDFTRGLSKVFSNLSRALKDGAPFVFTYHHNDLSAYIPLIVAILDAGLTCTTTLASPAEMSASLHIHGTGSSTVDSLFVCRKAAVGRYPHKNFPEVLTEQVDAIRNAGVKVTKGDVICIALGHLARITIDNLSNQWNRDLAIARRFEIALETMKELAAEFPPEDFAGNFV